MIKTSLKCMLCILLPLIIGAISGYATSSNIKTWYVTLQKPFFNPPNYLFAPVWTSLYIIMGLSLFLILQSPKTELRTRSIKVFSIQLTLNFLWSFLFFQFHNLGLALLEIVVMWCSILWMIVSFYKINKTAALINIPYLLWVTFATALNASIYFSNK